MFYGWCLFFYFHRKISKMGWPIGAKFRTVISTRLNFIMPVQNFGDPPEKNFRGQNQAKFGPISDDFKLQRQISPKQMKILKIGQVRFVPQFLPCWVKKVWWTAGPPITEIKWWNHTHPNQLFQKTIFWPLMGAEPPNFYTCHRMTKS